MTTSAAASLPFGLANGLGSWLRLRSAVERALGVTRLRAAYERIVARLPASHDVDAFLAGCLGELDVRIDVADDDLERIPTSGPLIVVANHPHGILDGLVLATLLRRRRPDLRILGNRWLNGMPAARSLLLDVDPIGGRSVAHSNTAPLRATHRWLAAGGALLTFPAGKVSARRWGRRGIHDDRWSPHVARLQRSTGAWVLPVHLGGANSEFFQWAGLVHPRLRTLLIARETLNKRGCTVPVRIGNPVQGRQLERFADPRELVDYLRLRTEILSRRDTPAAIPTGRSRATPEPIVAAVDPEALAAEIATLPADHLLLRSGDMSVHIAWAPQAPHTLREIGRLREETFRAVGEGTGRSIDLDRFDAHYLHLFVWHRQRRCIVGAYRLGHVDRILVSNDESGLYTRTLYHYDRRFLAHVSPALELGRSFVVAAFQREFLPLLMLWRGIATYVARNPRHCRLFGAVSISDRHHAVSKQLMLDHLQRYLDPAVSALVSPRHPVPPARPMLPLQWTETMVADLGDVDAMVAEIETSQRGVPVLLREYLRLGGRLAGLNVDPSFQHSITALVVIDLRRTDPRVLGRYMGRDAAKTFFAWHAAQPAAADCA